MFAFGLVCLGVWPIAMGWALGWVFVSVFELGTDLKFDLVFSSLAKKTETIARQESPLACVSTQIDAYSRKLWHPKCNKRTFNLQSADTRTCARVLYNKLRCNVYR